MRNLLAIYELYALKMWMFIVITIYFVALGYANIKTVVIAKNYGIIYRGKCYVNGYNKLLEMLSHLTTYINIYSVSKCILYIKETCIDIVQNFISLLQKCLHSNIQTGVNNVNDFIWLLSHFIICTWFVFTALEKPTTRQPQWIMVILYSLYFVAVEIWHYKDISDRMKNILFHASGYYRKAIFVTVLIQNTYNIVVTILILRYVRLLQSKYSIIIANAIKPFNILDAYTDGTASSIMLCIIIIASWINVRCNTNMGLFWFFLASISQIVGLVISTSIWYYKMDEEQFKETLIESIVIPIVVSASIQISVFILAKINDMQYHRRYSNQDMFQLIENENSAT